MYYLPNTQYPIDFPDYFETTPEGLLAIGGNLLPETLIDAYSKGIFPWFSEGDPILWWHPDPRLVIFPGHVHIPKRMRRLFNKACREFKGKTLNTGSEKYLYFITIDMDFKAVIQNCAAKRGRGRTSTWITPQMIDAYTNLHRLGFAHSVEVWDRARHLVGGMYGLVLGKIFFGESMFSHADNASKLALFSLCELLDQKAFLLLDCQVDSPHLRTLGARPISRREFLTFLNKGQTATKEPSLEFAIFRP